VRRSPANAVNDDALPLDIERENKMLFRSAAIWRGERIKKQGARTEADNRRTGDPNRIDVTAPEVA
jgi:hypothetical protein